MPIYTVIAMTSEQDPSAFMVAGVIEGQHNMVDSGSEEYGWYRYATSVEADNPDEAERLAAEEYEADTEADADDDDDAPNPSPDADRAITESVPFQHRKMW